MLLIVMNEELGYLLCDGAIFVCPCVYNRLCSVNACMYNRLNSMRKNDFWEVLMVLMKVSTSVHSEDTV